MKRFVFRLERVLEIRRTQAENEEKKLASLAAQRDSIRSKIEAIANERAASFAPAAPGAEVVAVAAQAAGSYRQFLDRLSTQVQAELRAAEQRVAEQRTVVIEATRRSELLERLREKQREQWDAMFALELEELGADAYRARRHAAAAAIQKR